MSRLVAAALIHFPVLGRGGETLTATVTNLDVHDLSRSARSYGLAAFFVVHPRPAQRLLGERIRAHWVSGTGRRRIPDRGAALELATFVADLDEALGRLGPGAEVWTTAAREGGGPVTTFARARELFAAPGPAVLLCFGTAWGLAPEVLARATVRLEPIVGRGDYNHLSVRAASAICLDRLLGPR
ncbi:MAG: RNA methyltransferase [Myxococcales bacterium]|nr:RNA methyltransferase [Myxococcales bacterium]